MVCVLLASLALALPAPQATAPQATAGQSAPLPLTAANREAPLPDPRQLFLDLERNEQHMEALQRQYTYHVHAEQQEVDSHGNVKKTETTEAESFTLDGIRVDRLVAKNGEPLTPDEARKEEKRIDDRVARAKERRAKAEQKGEATDDRGNGEISASRILELGHLSEPRRVDLDGRPTIVMTYTGDPEAKKHSTAEGVFRDLVGTVWIDEVDRVLVRGEGHFVDDFKVGGGLLADVRKGTHFEFAATHINGEVWLPAGITYAGSARFLLFAHFNGRGRITIADYRKFRATATIVGSHGAIDDQGQPIPQKPGGSAPATTPSSEPPAMPAPPPPERKPHR